MKESYSVFIVHRVGPGAYLSYRGRTAWTKRTAQKHINDLLKGIRTDSNVSYCILEKN